MIQHVPVIDEVRIVRSAQSWNQAGVVGYATVRVDGVHVAPIFLVRDIDGDIEQFFGVRVFGTDLPECLLDPDLRERIYFEVEDLIDQQDAGVPDE